MSKRADKLIEKAAKKKEELAKEYGVPATSIVWMGGDRFVVVKDGKEIWI